MRDVVLLGDSREILKTLPDASVDSVVTDPPAGISFMGKDWDNPDELHDGGHAARAAFIAFLTGIMAECLRVLKPGGHALVWSIPRTSHWTATAVEDAGFEIRDAVHHLFGQGFPKSLSVQRAILKMGGSENDAAKWTGWGTQLKPAVETWWLARKPIEAQNVASQVLATGTGGLNIDGSRIRTDVADAKAMERCNTPGSGRMYVSSSPIGTFERSSSSGHLDTTKGRWPSNLLLSHSPSCKRVGTKTVDAPTINRFTDGMKPFGDGAGHPYESSGGGTEEQPVYECDPECMVRKLDEQSGVTKSAMGRPGVQKDNEAVVNFNGKAISTPGVNQHGDQGGASRFFATFEPDYDVPFIYTGKASKADKNADLADAPPMMELRSDLTEEDRAFVLAELRAAGVVP